MKILNNLFKKHKINALGNYVLKCASYKDINCKYFSYAVALLLDNTITWSERKVVNQDPCLVIANYKGIISGVKRAIELKIKSLTIELDNVDIINHLNKFNMVDDIRYNYYDITIELIVSNFDNVYFHNITEQEILTCYKLSKQCIEEYIDLMHIEKQNLLKKLDFYEL
jgi:hypothetical protein